MKANSDKSKQSNKAARRVLAGVLCGASVLSLVLSLVMPPISQAIANDAQTEETVTVGGSSTESTDVENTNNVDTENQNSDDAGKGKVSCDADAASQSSDDAGAKSAEQPADDGANGEGAIALAAENEPTIKISSGTELSSKLVDKGLRTNGAATFELTTDIEYDDEIKLEGANTNITLKLNGFKITHDSDSKPLFDVAESATFTVEGSVPASETIDNGQPLQNQGKDLTPANYGKTAEMDYDPSSGIPTKLTYYVTESTASGTRTTEKIYKHEATIGGAIVGVTENSTMRLINVYQNGTFNLVSGAITQKKGCNVGSLIYAENGSIVNMSGGYVCGATSKSYGAGIELGVKENKGATLHLTGGVIARNCAPGGGGVYANGAEVTVTGGIISGNSTLDVGLGGGIMAEGGIVTVSGGYITNNRMAKFCNTEGSGCHGGAGLAAHRGAHVTISDGQITGNYSEEAGGGVYVTDQWGDGSRKDMTWLNITGGIIASNVSYRSEGAGIRVGQKIDAMIGPKESNDTKSKVYITNNTCLSRFDWGGGGIFVQGDSDTASNAGRLFVYNSYISSNEAGGYGGGVAVCPTGKTLVTNTDGTAIFDNTSAGSEQSANHYDSASNKGNDGTPHLSGGGHGKDQDSDAYDTKVFRENGHADFFLAAEGHNEPIAAVIGKMLGGGDAQYKGSKELKDAITIPANGGVQVYNSIGLSSGVKAGDPAATTAQSKATTFITGNYSWNHGGGIMSNGNLYLGQPADMYVYPNLKLKATKALDGRGLEDGEFSFTVYRKDSVDPFASGVFNHDVCTKVGTAQNDASGNITFDLGEQFASGGTGDEITYYLVEDPGNDSGITYDSSVYEIAVSAKDTKTVLMTVPKKDNPNEQIELNIHNYAIDKVNVTKYEFDNKSEQWKSVKAWSNVRKSDDYYPIACEDSSTTFTNEYTPSYTSSGFWTPKATKVVEGGEMKEFTLEFADNENFDSAKTVMTDPDGVITTTADGKKSQTRSFDEIEYKLDQLDKLKTDSTGRGASKTFTYYVREKKESSTYPHYKFDQSVYRFTVVATDNTKGGIDCAVTYRKGTVDSDGNWKADVGAGELNLTKTSIPTFTNTYSTSLPLSGMSGVTLTYLAGAAVLCAAAAWMHIRRKANAKGGKRRE